MKLTERGIQEAGDAKPTPPQVTAPVTDLSQKRPKRRIKDIQAAKSQAAKAFPLQGFNALQGITSRGVCLNAWKQVWRVKPP